MHFGRSEYPIRDPPAWYLKPHGEWDGSVRAPPALARSTAEAVGRFSVEPDPMRRFREFRPFGFLLAHEGRPTQEGHDDTVTEPKLPRETGR